MKRINACGPVAALFIAVLTGCHDRSGQSKTETTAAEPGSAGAAQTVNVCYRQIIGRDTTMVRLVVDGSAVTGELAVMPAEKDRAEGPFKGTLVNDRVVADWQRSGEGTTQVHEVNFAMAGDSLLWREGERVEKQGKWVLVNPNKGFQYRLTKVACTE